MEKKIKSKQSFDVWNNQKQKIHHENRELFFHEGEIRWVSLGKNIGTEIVGKGSTFSRPVLILRKVFKHSCLVIPLTSQEKNGSYYFKFEDSKGKKFYALLTQIRYIDGKRILGKISYISNQTHLNIQEAFIAIIKNIPYSCSCMSRGGFKEQQCIYII